jgi:hypothetical protein
MKNALTVFAICVVVVVIGSSIAAMLAKPPETTPVEPEKPYAPLCPDVIPKPEPKPEVNPPKPNRLANFNVWFDSHQKTCPQCSKMRDDPNEGFCLDAFHEMQECLKNPNYVPEPDPMPPVEPEVKQAEPQPTYRSAPRRRLFPRLFRR